MTKPLGSCDEFDELLSEAWERCTQDEKLPGSPLYGLLGRWLANLTYACPRPDVALDRLKALVCALRRCDDEALEEVLKNCVDDDCTLTPKTCRRHELTVAGQETPQTDVEKSADCALLAALSNADHCITLQQFFREVAVHTCDKGTLLMRITKDVLHDFQSFVEGVFSNRVTQIATVLGREQMTIANRYAKLEARTMSRAQLALLHVRFVMPKFVWHRYVSERGYMKSMVSCLCGIDEEALEPVTESAEDLRGKSLLYQLNWFRSEIERAEFENRGLYEHHTQLTGELAAIEHSIAEIQCGAAKEMSCMTLELENLRGRSADQVCTIDKLMDTIQMSMQKSKSNPVEHCS